MFCEEIIDDFIFDYWLSFVDWSGLFGSCVLSSEDILHSSLIFSSYWHVVLSDIFAE